MKRTTARKSAMRGASNSQPSVQAVNVEPPIEEMEYQEPDNSLNEPDNSVNESGVDHCEGEGDYQQQQQGNSDAEPIICSDSEDQTFDESALEQQHSDDESYGGVDAEELFKSLGLKSNPDTNEIDIVRIPNAQSLITETESLRTNRQLLVKYLHTTDLDNPFLVDFLKDDRLLQYHLTYDRPTTGSTVPEHIENNWLGQLSLTFTSSTAAREAAELISGCGGSFNVEFGLKKTEVKALESENWMDAVVIVKNFGDTEGASDKLREIFPDADIHVRSEKVIDNIRGQAILLYPSAARADEVMAEVSQLHPAVDDRQLIVLRWKKQEKSAPGNIYLPDGMLRLGERRLVLEAVEEMKVKSEKFGEKDWIKNKLLWCSEILRIDRRVRRQIGLALPSLDDLKRMKNMRSFGENEKKFILQRLYDPYEKITRALAAQELKEKIARDKEERDKKKQADEKKKAEEKTVSKSPAAAVKLAVKNGNDKKPGVKVQPKNETKTFTHKSPTKFGAQKRGVVSLMSARGRGHVDRSGGGGLLGAPPAFHPPVEAYPTPPHMPGVPPPVMLQQKMAAENHLQQQFRHQQELLLQQHQMHQHQLQQQLQASSRPTPLFGSEDLSGLMGQYSAAASVGGGMNHMDQIHGPPRKLPRYDEGIAARKNWGGGGDDGLLGQGPPGVRGGFGISGAPRGRGFSSRGGAATGGKLFLDEQGQLSTAQEPRQGYNRAAGLLDSLTSSNGGATRGGFRGRGALIQNRGGRVGGSGGRLSGGDGGGNRSGTGSGREGEKSDPVDLLLNLSQLLAERIQKNRESSM